MKREVIEFCRVADYVRSSLPHEDELPFVSDNRKPGAVLFARVCVLRADGDRHQNAFLFVIWVWWTQISFCFFCFFAAPASLSSELRLTGYERTAE